MYAKLKCIIVIDCLTLRINVWIYGEHEFLLMGKQVIAMFYQGCVCPTTCFSLIYGVLKML